MFAPVHSESRELGIRERERDVARLRQRVDSLRAVERIISEPTGDCFIETRADNRVVSSAAIQRNVRQAGVRARQQPSHFDGITYGTTCDRD